MGGYGCWCVGVGDGGIGEPGAYNGNLFGGFNSEIVVVVVLVVN